MRELARYECIGGREDGTTIPNQGPFAWVRRGTVKPDKRPGYTLYRMGVWDRGGKPVVVYVFAGNSHTVCDNCGVYHHRGPDACQLCGHALQTLA